VIGASGQEGAPKRTSGQEHAAAPGHEESAQTENRLPRVLRALRHRNYRLFIGGQLISLVGTWMQTVAQSWLVYRLTGSAVLLGVVGFSSQIPVFLLSSVGGTVADRYNRRRIVIATQTSSMILALILAGLTLAQVIQVWHIFILASLLGIVNAFDMPSRQSFIVEMVGREDLGNAIALNSSMVNSARMLGPAVAGILVSLVGEGWCFFLNGVSYIAVIAGLLMMNLLPRRPARKETSAFRSILEGFRYVWTTAPIRTLLLLLGLVSLMGMPYAVLMPLFADKILHGGPRGLGLLMAATGIGALVGALRLASKSDTRGLARWVMFASGGFGVCLILFSLSQTFWLSFALLLPTGFCMMTEMASSNTLIQSMVPDHLRGRVMAVYAMMFMGMAPFGSLLSGAVAERFGAPAAVAFGGTACILGSLAYARRMPSLRPEMRQMIVTMLAASPDNPVGDNLAAEENGDTDEKTPGKTT
jgi:MFS family permease